MRRFFYYFLSFLLLITFSTSFAKSIKTLAMTAIVEHPSLLEIRQGVEDELNEQGYQQGKSINIIYQSAHGSSANASQIAKQFASRKPDVIVAITTPSAQAMAASTKSVPIVFSGVTDPVAAKLIKNYQPTKNNITGISSYLNTDDQADFIVKIIPNIKKVGIIFSPHEVNSTIMIKQLEQSLKKYNVKVIAVPAQRTSDIPTALKSLQNKVDAIYTNTDNSVVSSYDSVVKFVNENKMPLLASFPDAIYRGAAAAYGFNDYDVGRETGKLVIEILKGKKVGEIAPQNVKPARLVLNLEAAKKQGIILTDKITGEAYKIIDSVTSAK